MTRQERITSEYTMAMKQIDKCMHWGWAHAYIYDVKLCPEVIAFLAEHGFDITIKSNNLPTTTVDWYKAEEGRKGEIVVPEYNPENINELGFIPDTVIEAVDARKIAGEQQYCDAKKAIDTAKGLNHTMTLILGPIYQEIGQRLNEEGIHVQVFLKESLAMSETRFFWGDKGSFTIINKI